MIGDLTGCLYVDKGKLTKTEKYDDVKEKHENCGSHILELMKRDMIKSLREGGGVDSMSAVTGAKGGCMAIGWAAIPVLCTVVMVQVKLPSTQTDQHSCCTSC